MGNILSNFISFAFIAGTVCLNIGCNSNDQKDKSSGLFTAQQTESAAVNEVMHMASQLSSCPEDRYDVALDHLKEKFDHLDSNEKILLANARKDNDSFLLLLAYQRVLPPVVHMAIALIEESKQFSSALSLNDNLVGDLTMWLVSHSSDVTKVDELIKLKGSHEKEILGVILERGRSGDDQESLKKLIVLFCDHGGSVSVVTEPEHIEYVLAHSKEAPTHFLSLKEDARKNWYEWSLEDVARDAGEKNLIAKKNPQVESWISTSVRTATNANVQRTITCLSTTGTSAVATQTNITATSTTPARAPASSLTSATANQQAPNTQALAPAIVQAALAPAIVQVALTPQVVGQPIAQIPPAPMGHYQTKYKLSQQAFRKPKKAALPNPIPAAPTAQEFANFVTLHVPTHAAINVQSGAQPTNVLGRLSAVLYNRVNFFAQAGINGPVIEEIHNKLRVIYARLNVNPRPANAQKLVRDLLDGSRYCLVGLMQKIDKVYNDIEAIDTLEEQVLRFLQPYKYLALDSYITERHPASITPAVQNSPALASSQFAHVRNAYIAMLGDDLGLDDVQTALLDPHARNAVTNPKNAALVDIISRLDLDDIIAGVVSDVNNENAQEASYISRDKVTYWAGANEDGLPFENKIYVAKLDFNVDYTWDQTNAHLFANAPQNKWLAWLRPKTACRMLKIEGFVVDRN